MPIAVSVPQNEGEIRIAVDGDPPVVYAVTDGQVLVDEERLVHFLTVIEGSALAEVTGDGTGTALPPLSTATDAVHTAAGFAYEED